MRDIGFVFVGWLLGILAPAVVDAIRRKRESKKVGAALKSELAELRYRAAMSAYYLRTRSGTVDRAFLEWAHAIVASYSGPNPKEGVLKSLTVQLAHTDEEIAKYVEFQKRDFAAVSLKKLSAPILDARVSALWELNPQVQIDLMWVRAKLDQYNEEIEEGRAYLHLSFSDLTPENRKGLNKNLDTCYSNVSDFGRSLADRIAAVRWPT